MKLSTVLFTLAAGSAALALRADPAEEVADPVPADFPNPGPGAGTGGDTKHVREIEDRAKALFYDNGVFDLEAIDARLQECAVVAELNHYLREENLSKPESLVQKLFASLFPFGAAGNAILATTYISGPPNFLLALIPPNINPASLNTLVSFAVGGLLGDVFLHLLPQTFVGEVPDDGESARFVVVDMKRNTVLGLAMFVGFLAFIMLDKGMRIMGAGHDHSHDQVTVTHKQHVELHGHFDGDEDADEEEEEEAETTGREKAQGLKKRGGTSNSNSTGDNDVLEADFTDSYTIEKPEPGSSIKLSAYLNLIADFTHNITDGLAISASFYISKSVGATTCLAVFFHGTLKPTL